MQRKVIQQGPSTLMISLPSKWVKENNIKKGSDIELDIESNRIVISREIIQQKKAATITIKNKEDYMNRLIITKYRHGFDELLVNYEDPAVVDSIRKTLHNLLGMEIIDQKANSCTIKNIAEALDENAEAMFKRMFHIILTMADSCLEFAKKKDAAKLALILELRETLLKLAEFNLRVINKTANQSVEQKSLSFFSTWNIGVLGKMWSYLAKEWSEQKSPNKISLSNKEINFIDEVVQYTRDYYQLHYKTDAAILLKIRNKRYHLRKEGFALLETSKNKTIIFNLTCIVEKIYDMSITY
ncbi:AbrB/MazE/SpoVT family DNA-binding domain-containing protein [Candidatus Woesearchaeota archaeon]|nr:AbrB/MazE/SpoVT family DNA-binding domain-containing protein [Candidatus Woesearchaeota archaeon]